MDVATPELVMQTDTLRATVLPALGGKIASLEWLPGKVELLQAPLAPYAARTLTMAFDESDASGFDECLPSVAACSVATRQGAVQVPDHGDFWRLEWEARQEGNEIRMSGAGISLPIRFERTIRLEGETLDLSYRVTNVGQEPVHYGWSAHPLFAVDRGDRIDLPASVKQVHVEGSAGQRLGPRHFKHAWPQAASDGRKAIDLSTAGGIADGVGDKLFAEAPEEGWAALERVQPGLRVEVQFDPERSPWLGLWLCYGGWPEGRANRQQCVAIEPCTAPVDSLAEAIATGQARRLEPGKSDEWPMRIHVRPVLLD
jgi:galactose mutarotase-like enzyme